MTGTPIDAHEVTRLFGLMQGARGILLAVSGGADSLALMLLAARWRETGGAGVAISVASVDHGLRREAAAECEHVGRLARECGMDHVVLGADRDLPPSRIEAAAREMRYRLLLAHAVRIGASHLATAHHRDDQAETVLMRLAAGSGPAGLAAMRAVSRRGAITHVRPLLGLDRAALEAVCRDGGVAWCEDAMNRDPRFARARLRGARGVLEGEGLSAPRLALFAERMARMEDAVAAQAEMAWQAAAREERDGVRIAGNDLLAMPEEIALRVIGRAVSAAGGEADRLARLEAAAGALIAALRAGKRAVRTLGGVRLEAAGGQLAAKLAAPRRAAVEKARGAGLQETKI